MKNGKIATTPGQRLAAAREAAGFKSRRAAAIEFGWPESTYSAHERGTRTIGQDDAERYAKRLRASGVKITAKDILFGSDTTTEVQEKRPVPIVGYVGAGAEAAYFANGQGPLEFVEGPEGTNETTVAVEIRGASLGALFDRWLVLYDEVRRPITSDLVGQLCVVGLSDERVLVKKLARGQIKGRYTLLSNTEPPIYDQTIEWAAKVKHMMPK